MAAYSISYTATSVTFTVTGLTSGDIVVLYLRNEPYTGTMILDDDTTYKATGSTFRFTEDDLSPNTSYAANVMVNWGDTLGTQYFTTGSLAPKRPSDWEWYSDIVSGGDIDLTADEWNDFCARINEFRAYKRLDAYSFTTAEVGAEISAAIVNEAGIAISEISGHGGLPSQAVPGGAVSAAFFHALQDALNGV